MGEVRDPQPVRGVGCEVTLDEVGGPLSGRVRPGGAHPFLPLDACDSESSHKPGDLVAADVVPGASGGDPQLAGPIDRVVGLPQRQQDRHHLRIAP